MVVVVILIVIVVAAVVVEVLDKVVPLAMIVVVADVVFALTDLDQKVLHNKWYLATCTYIETLNKPF